MRNRRYTEEIGVVCAERPVPKPIAIAILAAAAVFGGYIVRQVATFQPNHPVVGEEPAAAKAPVAAKIAQR